MIDFLRVVPVAASSGVQVEELVSVPIRSLVFDIGIIFEDEFRRALHDDSFYKVCSLKKTFFV